MWIRDNCSNKTPVNEYHHASKLKWSCSRKTEERGGGSHVALNILNVNINKYEQRQCNQFFRDDPFQCGSVGRTVASTSLHTTGSLCVPGEQMRREKSQ